jgi:hypothetical protein
MATFRSADNPRMRSPFLTGALCLSVLFLFSARAYAQGHVGEVGVMLWKPSPELVLSTDTLSSFSVDEVDFVQEFGIEDKWFPEYRATLGRSHKFRFSYVKFSYEADATIQRTFSFQGRTFTVGAPATTDIEWDLWKLGYEWDFVSTNQGFFGVFTDLTINQVQALVDSPALRAAATTDVTAPIPTIGVIGRGYLSRAVAITGQFSGLKWSNDEFDVKFFDLDIYGTIGSPNAGAQIGYRSVVADYLVDEDLGDLKMQGMYFGGYVRF